MEYSHFFHYPSGPHDPNEQPHFLADCTPQDTALLTQHARGRRFTAGSVVLAPGHIERALYLVLEGTLQVTPAMIAKEGRPYTIEAGAVFGELGFLDGQPNAAGILALTDVELLRLTLADFEAMAAKDPSLARYFLFDLARLLARRLHSLQILLPRTRR